MTTIEPAILRIRDRFGQPVGTGFVVQGGLLITCAHVVAAAIGERDYESVTSAPSALITFDFPMSNHQSELKAKVVGWRAYRSGAAGDIAVLQPTSLIPQDAIPVPLALKTDLWDKPFRAFGFPQNYPSGTWTDGSLKSREANGYFQLQNTNALGYRLQPGFSGAPVWVEQYQAVIGIVTLADISSNVYAGFAIPSSLLHEVMGEVNLSPSPSPNLGKGANPPTFGSTSQGQNAVKPASVAPSGWGFDDDFGMSVPPAPTPPPPPAKPASTPPPPPQPAPTGVMASPPTNSSTHNAANLSTHGISSLSALIELSANEIANLWTQYQPRAVHAQADADDLRSGGLIALWRRDFANAFSLIKRWVDSNPNDGYAHYALVLAAMAGKRPRALDDFQVAEAIQVELVKALTLDVGQSWAAILYFYLIVDYYEPSGLRWRGLTKDQCLNAVANGRIEKAEIQALGALCAALNQQQLYQIVMNA